MKQSVAEYDFALYYELHHKLLYTVQYATHFGLHYTLHYALHYALHSTLHYSLHNQCIINKCWRSVPLPGGQYMAISKQKCIHISS